MSTGPAEPILASALWQAHRSKQSENFPTGEEPARPLHLVTNCKSVDEHLAPGLSYGFGGLCCLSCEEDAGGGELINAYLISHLLDSANKATIIDPHGINILTLFATIKARLSLRPHVNPSLPPRDIEAEAKAVLDRVRIMRVFSFEGLLEALAEFRSSCEDAMRRSSRVDEAEHDLGPIAMSTLPDSQAPADADEEDLLSDPPHAADTTTSPSPPPQQSDDQDESTPEGKDILILTPAPLLQPQQRTNPTHASALLSSLLRTLRHTAQSYDLAVLLSNPTIPIFSTTSSPTRGTSNAAPTTENNARPPRDTAPTTSAASASPSIFASCTARPSFARVVDGAVDLHLLVHSVPRTADDARRAYGTAQSGAGAGTERAYVGASTGVAGGRGKGRGRRSDGADARGARWVSCVEVVGDRYGGRVGRFGFFRVGRDGVVEDGLG